MGLASEPLAEIVGCGLQGRTCEARFGTRIDRACRCKRLAACLHGSVVDLFLQLVDCNLMAVRPSKSCTALRMASTGMDAGKTPGF